MVVRIWVDSFQGLVKGWKRGFKLFCGTGVAMRKLEGGGWGGGKGVGVGGERDDGKEVGGWVGGRRMR